MTDDYMTELVRERDDLRKLCEHWIDVKDEYIGKYCDAIAERDALKAKLEQAKEALVRLANPELKPIISGEYEAMMIAKEALQQLETE